ncbi:MAG TPA: PAS domain S-box protein, partial [Gemmatimonadaceae bacterium]|nr:PAS domain S-box protein [Gemmatimonadaceae bacterium]
MKTLGALRVLVLDDDLADAELSLEALRSAGASVQADIAQSPGEFRARVRAGTYDVVLADYQLPAWTGMDALRELRSMGISTPLILVTGALGDQRAVECVKGGVADYVLKENLAMLPVSVARTVHTRRDKEALANAAVRTREFEEAAREREARFAQLADTISEVFYLVAADYSSTLFINRAYETIWGRSVQSLYDNPPSFLDAVHERDRPALVAHIGRVQSGEQPERVTFRVVRPNGDVRWVVSRAVPVRNADGAVDRISGVATDITDERLAQLALEESEARFRKLVDAAFDAILITRMGIIREVNRGFLEMFGLDSAEEAIGRSVLDFTAPEDRLTVAQRVFDGAQHPADIVALRKDGRKITIEVTARDHDVEGVPGRITALRDVTRARTLEQQVLQTQKMEAVGRLAGGVAHDFNNLLTVISSYARLVHDDLGSHDPRREDIEEILKASAGAAGLTRQLLTFSRREVIQPRDVVLNDLVVSVDKLLRRLIGEDITLATALSAEQLVIHVDPGQFEQIIVNLAVNARDAMPKGGRVTIETARADFDDSYSEAHWPATPGPFAMLAVSDTGVGMDAETRTRAFEPFFTTKGVGEGTGLGLATVYGIVKQAGGFIWVYSEPGAGTTFKVYMPLV